METKTLRETIADTELNRALIAGMDTYPWKGANILDLPVKYLTKERMHEVRKGFRDTLPLDSWDHINQVPPPIQGPVKTEEAFIVGNRLAVDRLSEVQCIGGPLTMIALHLKAYGQALAASIEERDGDLPSFLSVGQEEDYPLRIEDLGYNETGMIHEYSIRWPMRLMIFSDDDTGEAIDEPAIV